jgi:hypothetical protein
MKAIILFLLITLWCLGSALAQNHPYGRWQHETINKYGTITRYVYHFKPNDLFIFERSIRSDSEKFTSHIVVEGTWSMTYFEESQRKLLSGYDILSEYYAIDGLKSLKQINIQLRTVVSSMAKYDNGRINTAEQDALAEAWGKAQLKELIPYQDSNDQMIVLSPSEGKFRKMVYKKMP